MKKPLSMVAIFSLLLVLWAAQASAAITAQLATNQAAYTGSCPVKVQFTGSISGPAGTKVSYEFYRAGKPTNIFTSATIPQTGVLNVADSESYASSTIDFDQIYVANPANAYSQRVNVSITCQSSGLNASSIHKYHVSYVPNAPSGLTYMTSPDACAGHALLLFCNAALQSKKLVLIWDWSPSAEYKAVNAFKVYETQGRSRRLLDTISADPNADLSQLQRASFIPLNLSNPIYDYGKCWVVTAVSGEKESADSRPYCISSAGSNLTSTTRVLRAARTRPYSEYKQSNGISRSIVLDPRGIVAACSAGLCVGHYYSAAQADLGDLWENRIWRAGVWFDVGSLHANKIFKATLNLKASDGVLRCLNAVTPGEKDWTNTYSMEGVWSQQTHVTGSNMATMSIDVTNFARQWLTDPNYGLLVTGEENLKAFTNDICVDNLAPPTLTLIYV